MLRCFLCRRSVSSNLDFLQIIWQMPYLPNRKKSSHSGKRKRLQNAFFQQITVNFFKNFSYIWENSLVRKMQLWDLFGIFVYKALYINNFRDEAIHNWYSGIINSLYSPITNGFTEGCNNKIKVLKRNAYGYKNFNRFRNRILHIFSHQNLNNNQAVAWLQLLDYTFHFNFFTPTIDKEPFFAKTVQSVDCTA